MPLSIDQHGVVDPAVSFSDTRGTNVYGQFGQDFATGQWQGVPVQGAGAAPQTPPGGRPRASRSSTSPQARPGPPRGLRMNPEVAAANCTLVPISHLGQYMQNWRIRVRVKSRSSIRRFTNSRGPGQLFSLDVFDAAGSGIRVTFFGSLVDKHFSTMQVGAVYDLSGGQIKPGNPKFCHYPLEITLDERHSVVSAIPEDGTISGITYNFVKLADLTSKPVKSTTDVLAVVSEVQEPSDIQLKSGESRRRRGIILRDHSGASVKMTLWGDRADTQVEVGAVVLAAGVKISDFGGLSLDMGEEGQLEVSPDDARAFSLQRWWQEHSKDPVRVQLSGGNGGSQGRKKKRLVTCFKEDMSLGLETPGDQPQDPSVRMVHVHNVTATILNIPYQERLPMYLACTAKVPGRDGEERECRRKVQQGYCASSHQCDNPIARYTLSLRIADATGFSYVSCFGEEAEAVLGAPAHELYRLWEAQNEGNIEAGRMFDQYFNRALMRQFSFQIRSKREVWEGQDRVKRTVMEVKPVNYAAEARNMLSEVQQALMAS